MPFAIPLTGLHLQSLEHAIAPAPTENTSCDTANTERQKNEANDDRTVVVWIGGECDCGRVADAILEGECQTYGGTESDKKRLVA